MYINANVADMNAMMLDPHLPSRVFLRQKCFGEIQTHNEIIGYLFAQS